MCVCEQVRVCVRVLLMQIDGPQVYVLAIFSIATGLLSESTLVCFLAVLTHFRMTTQTKRARCSRVRECIFVCFVAVLQGAVKQLG